MKENICVANWRWRIVFTRIAAQENFEELKGSCIYGGGKYWKITRTIGIFWRFENLLRSWLTEQLWQYLVLHQTLYYLEFNKALLRNWNAAKYTRRFEFSWKGFWLLTCSTRSWWIFQMIQEIWRHYWVFWEQKELRKVRAKNHCSQHLHLVLRYEQDERSKRWESVQSLWLTMPRVLGLVLKAWQFRVISPRKCICKNSLTKQNFRGE